MIKRLLLLILGVFSKFYSLVLTTIYSGLKIELSGNSLFFLTLRVKGSCTLNVGRNSIIWKCKIISSGENNKIEFGSNVKLFNSIIIVNGNNSMVKIEGGRNISKSKFQLLDNNNKFISGRKTGYNQNRVVVAGHGNSIIVGDDCIFAENAEIWSSDTHSIIDSGSNRRINIDKPISIGNHVWIGNRVLIHKGVTIGNNAVLAAGSIVTKDIQDGTLVGGIPAQILKKNITWNIERI